jgi:hypothetical protein
VNIKLLKRHKTLHKEGMIMMELLELFNRKKVPEHKILKAVGGVALAALAVSLLVNLPDIKRYIKINTM